MVDQTHLTKTISAGILCWLTLSSIASATTVKCGSGQTISDAITKLKPSLNYQQLTVTGACTENVTVPPNLALALIGSKGASLAPANANEATITSNGKLFIQGFTITGGSFTAIFSNAGGWVTVAGDIVTGGTGAGLQISDNAGGIVQNSSIVTSGYSAISLYAGGQLEIDGVAPIGSLTGTTITGAQVGISCGIGSIQLAASGGPILITGNAQNGIYSRGCSVNSYASNGETITITNNKGDGIYAAPGTSMQLTDLAVTNNGGAGVHVNEGGGVEFGGGMTITGNASSAIYASKGAVLNFYGYAGVNTVTEPQGNTNVLFSCYQNGQIYADQISGVITPPPTQQNIGCLQVGN
jgi:hypothetical protein